MAKPTEILDLAYTQAVNAGSNSLINDDKIRERVRLVVGNEKNRACVRLLMSCLLAKASDTTKDVRKPYTEIGDSDAFSGRNIDEKYIFPFITKKNLPCNPTTAFLTPAFRNRSIVLTPSVNLVGKPPELYKTTLLLLDDVHKNKIEATVLLGEVIRELILLKNRKRSRIRNLLTSLKKNGAGALPLSVSAIVDLLKLQIKHAGSSRLPVLIVVAAYSIIEHYLEEKVLPLYVHNAADKQTGALGDVEIIRVNHEKVITVYEMKMKRVTRDDIDIAVEKLAASKKVVDGYIFITTERIDEEVVEYSKTLYSKMGGTEFLILDCVDFAIHFLNIFRGLRMEYLEAYQKLLLSEPDSAVSQQIKEEFLSLRKGLEGAAL